MRHRTALPSIAAVVAALAGCGRTIVRSSELSPFDVIAVGPAHGGSSATRVVRSDLMAIQETSLDAALGRLRPEWLRVNPSSRQVAQPAHASVYIDNVYMGDLDALRLVPVSAVIDVRFLAPSAARDQFGSACRCEAGVILVVTRRAN